MNNGHSIFELTKKQKDRHKDQIKSMIIEILKEQKEYHREQIRIINSALKKLDASSDEKCTRKNK